MTPESLGQVLEEFLGCSRHAVVLDDGAMVFDGVKRRGVLAPSKLPQACAQHGG